MEIKYLLTVTEPAGWIILDSPRPLSNGGQRRRAEAVGKVVHCYDILLFDGVPYAYLVPQDPNKPEWGRVSEAGGVFFEEEDGKLTQVQGVKAYVKVVSLKQTSSNSHGTASLADAIMSLADAVREAVRK